MSEIKETPNFNDVIILRTTDMSVGKIETNIESVLEAVKEKSRQYQDVTKYNGDEKQAKEDRALLRKQKDMTKTTIATIQNMWNEPLEQFLSCSKQILKEFDYAIDTIDEWVKEGEAVEKEKKRSEIQAYFDNKNFELVPLAHFFDNRWLNKTIKMQEVKKDIDDRIESIYSNIKILENIGEHGMAAKAFYLDSLDMGAAMRKVEMLKENAERLIKEKIEREERERQEQIRQQAKEEQKELVEEKKQEEFIEKRNEFYESLGFTTEKPVEEKPEMMEFTLRFKNTKEECFKLREYLTANGFTYEKIALYETHWEVIGNHS